MTLTNGGPGQQHTLVQALTVTLQPISNQPPTVTITAPANGAAFAFGASVAFAGSASDDEDGDISANLSWSSDLDGTIGVGHQLQHHSPERWHSHHHSLGHRFGRRRGQRLDLGDDHQ